MSREREGVSRESQEEKERGRESQEKSLKRVSRIEREREKGRSVGCRESLCTHSLSLSLFPERVSERERETHCGQGKCKLLTLQKRNKGESWSFVLLKK